jgi:Tfp pilus assembly PilM family ATPase
VKKFDFVFKIEEDGFKIVYLSKNEIKFLNYNFDKKLNFTEKLIYIREALPKILKQNNIKGKNIKIVIDGKDLVFFTNKYLEVPQFENMIIFEIKKYFISEQKEVSGDYLITFKKGNSNITIVSGMIENNLDALKDLFKSLRMKVEFITPFFIPLYLTFKNFCKDRKYIVINFSSFLTTFLYVKENKLFFVRGVKNISFDQFCEYTSRELMTEKEKIVESVKNENFFTDKRFFYIRPFFEIFIKELNITKGFISEFFMDVSYEKFYLIGEGAEIKGIKEYFKENNIEIFIPEFKYKNKTIPINFFDSFGSILNEKVDIDFLNPKIRKKIEIYWRKYVNIFLLCIFIIYGMNLITSYYRNKVEKFPPEKSQTRFVDYYEKENLYPEFLFLIGIYIPKDTKVNKIEINNKNFKITGTSQNQKSIISFSKELEKTGIFKDIKIESLYKKENFTDFEISGNIK